MIEARHVASPPNLPWLITEPGQIHTLMVFTGIILVLFTIAMAS